MNLQVVVLAGGRGKRMHSRLPKALHELGGRPLLAHVLGTAHELSPQKICVVSGEDTAQLQAACPDPAICWALQPQPLGSGDAMAQALPRLDKTALALVLYCDVPLIRAETLSKVVASALETNAIVLLTCRPADPSGLGRIQRDADGNVGEIIEQRDLKPEQADLRETHSGIMCAPVELIAELLPQITNANRQNEYYLTDLVGLAVDGGRPVHGFIVENEHEVIGINSRTQLAAAERHFQQRQAAALMAAGVTLMDPQRLDVRGEVHPAPDCVIDVNVVLEGTVHLGEQVHIGPNCCLRDVTLGDATKVLANSVIEGAEIGKECQIGPFARIRPGTDVADDVRIGNFVEVKNASLGEGVKAGHLAYLGDAAIGTDTNIGAGSVTCNYDGQKKSRTVIGNRVFVGTNSTLVAPLTIAEDAYIAAGSTITKDVQPSELAIGRVRQRTIADWKRPK